MRQPDSTSRFSNKYARVVAGAVLVIFITLILGTTDYIGPCAGLIEKAVETPETPIMAFFWKMLLTALTMKKLVFAEAKSFRLSA